VENNLSLTASERKTFASLPVAIREGWTVNDFSITHTESPEELYLRYRMARFEDPAYAALAASVHNAKSPDDFLRVAEKFQFHEGAIDQLSELFFVLGTNVLSGIVAYLLKNAKDDEDIEGIAALTTVRRFLHESNAEFVS